MKRFFIHAPALFLLLARSSSQPPAPMIVHEWGTITTRHRPDGTPIGHLNRINASEVLPAFVHTFVPNPTAAAQNSLLKTPLTPGRPDVTMRLETPVLYFYPPPGARNVNPFGVHVRFRGGVMNEFYPAAAPAVAVDAERVNVKMAAGVVKSWDGATLDNYVVSDLEWRNIALRDSVQPPNTDSHVWLAPRQVHASGVTVGGESERYLFYRGVAHLDALMQTRLTVREVILSAPARMLWLGDTSMTITRLWLVDVRKDGTTAFSERSHVRISRDAPSAELLRFARFANADFSAANRQSLNTAMKTALTKAGLFADEADAMLATWKESYFETPGLRVLYLVPEQWKAYFLPLSISVPAEVTRVLVGRIDILQQ